VRIRRAAGLWWASFVAKARAISFGIALAFFIWIVSVVRRDMRGGDEVQAAAGALEKIKHGLSFERWLLCPAGTGAFLFLLFGPPARRAAIHGGHYIRACIATPSRRVKPGLSFERRFLCPAGTGAFFSCCLGRLRRGQGGAGYGGHYSPPPVSQFRHHGNQSFAPSFGEIHIPCRSFMPLMVTPRAKYTVLVPTIPESRTLM